MTRATFFKHFDLLADTPDAVAKMRELLLELALQGKLVPQDAQDEPATVLLDRIAKLRAKTGKASDEISQPVSAEEAPYRLPASWVWTRLSVAGDTNPRNNLEDDTEVSFVPMKLISATYGAPVQSEKREWGEVRRGFTHFADNDVVVAKITPCFENGKSAVVRELASGYGAGTTELHVFRPLGKTIVPEYVLIYLKSPSFLRGGVEHMTGTAGQQRVAFEFFAENPFPLPPLAEQKRIVGKVEELMGLCDELAARQQAQREARARLTQSGFTHLTAAPDEKAFRHHAGFLLQHSAIAFDDVAPLRKTILHLGFQGHLIRQDPKDEPANILLSKLRKEKERLRQSGDLNQTASLAPLEPSEMPEQIPSGWTWCRLGEMIDCFRGHNPPKEKFIHEHREGYVRFIQITDFKTDDRAVYVPVTKQLKLVRRGEILMAAYRNIGKLSRNVEGAFNVACCKIIDIAPVSRDFVELLIGTDYVKGALLEASGRAHIPSMHTDHLLSLAVPLPPLAEQKRIVAKVGELLRLCDELAAQLNQSRTHGEHLLAATLRQLLKDEG